MTLVQALNILAKVHTRENEVSGYVVQVPPEYDHAFIGNQSEYVEAWGMVRKFCRLPNRRKDRRKETMSEEDEEALREGQRTLRQGQKDLREKDLREEITQAHIALNTACVNLVTLTERNEKLVKTLTSSMRLTDELLTELGRLCAATSTPPPVSIFSAKRDLDTRMRELLTHEANRLLPKEEPAKEGS